MTSLAILLVLAALPIVPEGAVQQPTIVNLNAAIQGEADAVRRYQLFAQQADEEGLPSVAKLFRAASLSDAIQRRNHEQVLRGLGIEPILPEAREIQVGTTRENLIARIGAAAREAGELYPAFVAEAQRSDVPGAAQSFTYALETEAQHVQLFTGALENLGTHRPVTYYVGKTSGGLTTTPPDGEPYELVE